MHNMSNLKPIFCVVFRSFLKLMPMGDFFEEQFKFADVFNLLKLSDAEVGLFAGILILNPGKTSPYI